MDVQGWTLDLCLCVCDYIHEESERERELQIIGPLLNGMRACKSGHFIFNEVDNE